MGLFDKSAGICLSVSAQVILFASYAVAHSIGLLKGLAVGLGQQ